MPLVKPLADFLNERDQRTARADAGIAVAAAADAAGQERAQQAVALVLALSDAELAKLLSERGRRIGSARAHRAALALTAGAQGRGRPPSPDERAIAKARAAIASGTPRDVALRNIAAEVAQATGARLDTVRRRLSNKLG